jgi:molybdopterin-binding protein
MKLNDGHLSVRRDDEYICTRNIIDHCHSGSKKIKLSARNQLKGKIVDVTKGATTSHVVVDVGHGVVVTASITNEAVADLGLKKGDDAWAVIKASDVMIGK